MCKLRYCVNCLESTQGEAFQVVECAKLSAKTSDASRIPPFTRLDWPNRSFSLDCNAFTVRAMNVTCHFRDIMADAEMLRWLVQASSSCELRSQSVMRCRDNLAKDIVTVWKSNIIEMSLS